MPFPGSIPTDLANAITSGALSQARSTTVGRILTQMFAFGMFDNPQPAPSPPPSPARRTSRPRCS